MQVRHVTESDFSLIDHWHISRGFPSIKKPLYPNVGFIVDGLAAAWIMQTDCKVALVENIATNPDADKEERKIALEMILQELVSFAKMNGYLYLVGFSKLEVIKEYACTIGGESLGSVMMYGKEL